MRSRACIWESSSHLDLHIASRCDEDSQRKLIQYCMCIPLFDFLWVAPALSNYAINAAGQQMIFARGIYDVGGFLWWGRVLSGYQTGYALYTLFNIQNVEIKSHSSGMVVQSIDKKNDFVPTVSIFGDGPGGMEYAHCEGLSVRCLVATSSRCAALRLQTKYRLDRSAFRKSKQRHRPPRLAAACTKSPGENIEYDGTTHAISPMS